VDCVLPRGGGVFFHCNTLHASDPNTSPNPRWGLICCYNTKTNGLTFQSPPMSNHPSYDRVGALEIWDDDEVRLSSPSPGFFSQLLTAHLIVGQQRSQVIRVGQKHWAELSGRPSL
jgi:hypothetical protein